MNILLPEKLENQLSIALRKAGTQEIGGILMGEYIKDGVYRITNLTIQRHRGTFMSFIRSIQEILLPLQSFFYQTGQQYTRFNYLGEWHSHPSFSLEPSTIDCKTMWDIVEDIKVGANFAVLLTVRLNRTQQLEGYATVYTPGQQKFRGELIKEHDRE